MSDTEYNNPFVANLILDDNQFLKPCSNIKNYMLSNVKLTDQIRTNEYTKQTKHGLMEIHKLNNSLQL